MNKIKVVILMKHPVAAEDLRQRLERMNCSIYENWKRGRGLAKGPGDDADLVFLNLMLKGDRWNGSSPYLRYTLGIPVVLLTGFANRRFFI